MKRGHASEMPIATDAAGGGTSEAFTAASNSVCIGLRNLTNCVTVGILNYE